MNFVLPRKLDERKKVVITATFDFFGQDIDKEEKLSAKKIALWLMNRKRKKITFTDEEKSALWFIKKNLEDAVYVKNLTEN